MEPSFSTKLMLFLSGFSGFTAYAAILFVLLICGLGVPIPEDITLICAGILAGTQKISLAGAFIAGFVGVMIGDAFLFFLGRKLGERAFELPMIRKIFTPKRKQLAKEKVVNNSKFICFTARFLPGLRSAVFLTAGVMGVKPKVFFLLDGFAALISVPVWVFAGYWFSKNIDEAFEFAKQAQLYLLIGLGFLIFGYYIYKKKFSKKIQA